MRRKEVEKGIGKEIDWVGWGRIGREKMIERENEIGISWKGNYGIGMIGIEDMEERIRNKSELRMCINEGMRKIMMIDEMDEMNEESGREEEIEEEKNGEKKNEKKREKIEKMIEKKEIDERWENKKNEEDKKE